MNYMVVHFAKTQNGSQELEHKAYADNIDNAYYGYYDYLKTASQSTKAIDGVYMMDENGKMIEEPKVFYHSAS